MNELHYWYHQSWVAVVPPFVACLLLTEHLAVSAFCRTCLVCLSLLDELVPLRVWCGTSRVWCRCTAVRPVSSSNDERFQPTCAQQHGVMEVRIVVLRHLLFRPNNSAVASSIGNQSNESHSWSPILGVCAQQLDGFAAALGKHEWDSTNRQVFLALQCGTVIITRANKQLLRANVDKMV